MKRNTTFCLVNRPCQFCKRGSCRKSSKSARTKFSWAIYSPTGRRSQVKQVLFPKTDLSNKTTGTKVCKWDKLRGQKKVREGHKKIEFVFTKNVVAGIKLSSGTCVWHFYLFTTFLQAKITCWNCDQMMPWNIKNLWYQNKIF